MSFANWILLFVISSLHGLLTLWMLLIRSEWCFTHRDNSTDEKKKEWHQKCHRRFCSVHHFQGEDCNGNFNMFFFSFFRISQRNSKLNTQRHALRISCTDPKRGEIISHSLGDFCRRSKPLNQHEYSCWVYKMQWRTTRKWTNARMGALRRLVMPSTGNFVVRVLSSTHPPRKQ